ncbi:MAG: putative flavoprotein [Methanobacterium sp. Maddingley MBC34]|nr:MAG: putative flavoprotein [Methanobacterium sp. Maddingley MBC34]
MSNLKNVLILVGSPKGKNSASNNFALYLEDKFQEKGIETEKAYLVEHQKPKRLKKLVEKAFIPELLVIVAPLYIDSIPAITINFMEECYKSKEDSHNQKLMAVFNSGFPEPNHNDLAIRMCKNFASKMDMEWMGGITIGMGAAFERSSLIDAGGMARNLRKGLDAAVESLSHNKPMPSEAVLTASKPLLPLFLSKFFMCYFGEWLWKRKVKDKAVRKKMRYRPYKFQ